MKSIFPYIILIAGVLTVITACSKFRKMDDDNKGESIIRGRLFLSDSLTQSGAPVALGDKKLTIRYADLTDTSNYLLETSTSTDGYFTFKNLKAGTNYVIIYEELDKDILYRATATVEAPKDTLVLLSAISEDKQNGFHVVIADSTNGTYAAAEICIFNGRQAFASRSCSLATFKIETDSFGRAYAFSVPPARYYFYATVSENNQEYFISDSLDVTNKLVRDTFYLQKKAAVNGMQYIVLDEAGDRVAGGSICVFTSGELFKRDTCEGSNFEMEVDEFGNAGKTGIPPNTYYLLLKKSYGDGSLRWVARDTIVVTDKLKSDTLHLRPY